MSSPPNKNSSPQQSTAAFASSPTILRRKKDGPGGAFGVASKVFDTLRDGVGGAMGKMTTADGGAAGGGLKDKKLLGDKGVGSGNAAEGKMPSTIEDMTSAFSVSLCHILAPLWSVGVDLLPTPASALPRLDYGSPAILNFASQVIDQMPLDADVDIISEHLSRDRQYATAFIVVMLAKVLLIERTFQRGSQVAMTVTEEEFIRSSTTDLLANLEQELRVKSSEPTKDSWPNDETSTSDMPSRLLAEVGGSSNKPRGPAELSPFLNHYRLRCLIRALQVSACYPYYYCDSGIQYCCEAIAAQLFLVNFSEALVTLVSGRKGPCYIGKYIIHLAGSRCPIKDQVDTLINVTSPSTMLTQTNQLVALSFDNFLHRNDIAETVIPAMVQALENAPHPYLSAVMRYCKMLLHDINCSDIGMLVELMDTARRHVVTSRPVGDAALDLVRAAWMCVRTVGCLQRDAMSRTFVAGAQMRSFRRRPIHLVTNTYAARSFMTTKMFRLPVGVQRGPNYRVPVALSGRIDPMTGQPLPQGEFSDDSLKYVSNVIINVFQAAVELCETGLELQQAKSVEEKNPTMMASNQQQQHQGDFNSPNNANNTTSSSANFGDRAGGGGGHTVDDELIASSQRLLNAPAIKDNILSIAKTISEHVDLRILYSIPPSIMVANVQRVIALFPKSIVANEYSDPSQLRLFSDLGHANSAVLAAIYEIYLSIADYAKPVRGIAKIYRNENPFRPIRPILTTVLVENEPVADSFREMCMALWKHCDARILDSEPASTHPQKDLALSQFVEDEMDIALFAGGGTLRRLAHAIAVQKIEYPGTVPSPRFFLLPCGQDNDLASWIARCDPTYRLNVFSPFLVKQPTSGSVKPDELQQPNELSGHGAPTFDSLLVRRTLDYYTQNARYANDIIVYQVECFSADGTKGVTMMTSNFEIGFHLNVAAVATSHSAGKESLGPAPAPRGANRSRAGTSNSNKNPSETASTSENVSDRTSNVADGTSTASGNALLPTTFRPLPRPESEGSPAQWNALPYTNSAKDYLKTSCGQLFVQIGEVIESADWLMLQMHGPQGLKLQSRKNPADSNSMVPSCASGSDVLDWLGSVYHAFDTRSATKAAQHLLDLGFLSCVAVSPGRNASNFSELNLYIPRARGTSDQPVPALPTSKSRAYGIAQGIKDVLRSISALHENVISPNADAAAVNNNKADLPKPIPQLGCTVRVGFHHRPEDAHYQELSPPKPTDGGPLTPLKSRDVVFLKVRSCGSANDAGPAADPCSAALEMSICETNTAGRHDSINPKDATGPNGEPLIPVLEQRHFTLNFGDRDESTGKFTINPRCELAIDTALPPPEDRSGPPLGRDAGAPANLFCSVDGDVIGPFASFRIRPLLMNVEKKQPATISVMSFTPLNSDRA